MRYEVEAADRIRGWKTSDPTLYTATEEVLRSIAREPQTFGTKGSPLVDRLTSYGVPGRDEQYCITWDAQGDEPVILSASTNTELAQRVQFQRSHGLRD